MAGTTVTEDQQRIVELEAEVTRLRDALALIGTLAAHADPGSGLVLRPPQLRACPPGRN